MDIKPQSALALGGTLRENIAALTERKRREAAAAPLSQRAADAITTFAGSMTFVGIHALFYGGWIIANLGWLPGVEPFDPTFVVLAMEASVEAIFLSTFVLISQNRQAAIAERRAELDLHINLLAEHELTTLAQLVERIARKLEVDPDARDFAEITTDVEPTRVMDTLDATGEAAMPHS